MAHASLQNKNSIMWTVVRIASHNPTQSILAALTAHNQPFIQPLTTECVRLHFALPAVLAGLWALSFCLVFCCYQQFYDIFNSLCPYVQGWYYRWEAVMACLHHRMVWLHTHIVTYQV